MAGRKGRGKGGTWIQLLILRILYETPQHGYALNERVNSFQAGRRPIKPGSLYTILRRMEKDGLLESTWDEESSRLNRRVYTLSDFGKQRLKEGRSMVESQIAILTEMKQFYDKHFLERESDEQT
ncbi:PadR family transcriptional regulator [Thermoproteota archaeon]